MDTYWFVLFAKQAKALIASAPLPWLLQFKVHDKSVGEGAFKPEATVRQAIFIAQKPTVREAIFITEKATVREAIFITEKATVREATFIAEEATVSYPFMPSFARFPSPGR